ncbi:hypothetical protein ARMA_1734 [Ardenticatena maritima]|uniref:HTH HARE-type domain-containing protein n=2 Tax=Ardenticatena maritima TaxID=872965 RepID=A0A0M8K916_9CHLR|nr:hypothetical protein ARMA_1734 [Ardenticatena maritima]
MTRTISRHTMNEGMKEETTHLEATMATPNSTTPMTYLDAAYVVLRDAGQPLHYREITQRALERGLIAPAGLTPDATMGSRLYTDTKQSGSRFVRAGRGVFGLAEWEPTGLEAAIAQQEKKVRQELRARLLQMPPERFEALVAELLLQMGFEENSIQVTQRSNDGGIDVVGIFRAAGITHLHTAVQVKRWKQPVGARLVRELRGSLEAHQHGMILTTSFFTPAARSEAVAAGKKAITLIDGETLLDLLIKYRVGIVDRQVFILDLDEEWWHEWNSADTGRAENAPAERESSKAPEAPRSGRVRSKTQRARNTRITGMRLLGREYRLRTWREALLTVCQVLAEQHSDFAQRAVTLKGRKRQYVAPTPSGMIGPKRIPNTSLWVETNLSAQSTQKMIANLLELFGYSAQDVAFFSET